MMRQKKIWLLLLAPMLTLLLAAASPFDGSVHTVTYYENNARTLIKAGDNAGARKVLTQGLRSYPTSSILNELMGRTYYNTDKLDKARYYLFRAVREERTNLQARELLVNVEERTGNYSSAICYINELLELSPYNKNLWVKKMNIYRRQGNTAEYNRILKRLTQIFPDDVTFKNRLRGQMEEYVVKARKQGNIPGAIAALEGALKDHKGTVEDYLQLSNLLLQNGQADEALVAAIRGLTAYPANVQLVEKRVSILSGQHRYGEALDYLKGYLRTHSSSRLSSLLNSLQDEAAAAATNNDPYTLYGRMYERSKSSEALDYLLNTSLSRGYVDDALTYISAARKTRGNSPALMYKEYTVYKRMGDTRKAVALLERLYQMQPGNRDLGDELAGYRMEQATDLMVTMNYTEALPLLRFVVRHSTDDERKLAAMNHIYTCQFETRRYAAASAMLDSIHRMFPKQQSYVVKHATVLDRQGKTIEALASIENALNSADVKGEQRSHYLATYEEIVVPFIKSLINQGAITSAMDATEQFLRLFPSSKDGLNYALTCSGLLHRDTDYDNYAAMAVGYYPDDLNFRIKSTAGLQRRQEYAEALTLLRPWLDTYSNDSSLIGAYSENSALLANRHIKDHKGSRALAVLDSALVFDRTNAGLLYTKGLAFESLHQYDSAYVYQKYYKPDLMEVNEHRTHLDQLLSRSATNLLVASYRQSRYGDTNILSSVAGLAYIRKCSINSYTYKVNYAGRDGNDLGVNDSEYMPGGIGLQGIFEWEHRFGERWTGTGTVGLASKFFPTIMLNLKLARMLRNDLTVDVHAGYRRVESTSRNYTFDTDYSTWNVTSWNVSKKGMLNIGVGAVKTFDQVAFTGRADGLFFGSSLCYSLMGQAAYTPANSRLLNLHLTGSVGNAPEASVLDVALPGTFSKVNSNVGVGGSYLLTPALTLSIDGSWLTFPRVLNIRKGTSEDSYTDTIDTRYRNLFSIDASIIFSF